MSAKSFIAVASVLTVVGVAGAWHTTTTSQAHVVVREVRTETCTLKVSGMTCAGCEAAVRMAARKVDGVRDVAVGHETGKAEVTYEPSKTTPSAIAKAITDGSGFKAEVESEQGQ